MDLPSVETSAGAPLRGEASLTVGLVARLMRMRSEPLAPEAGTIGKQCVLDWLGVTLAARDEPLTRILLDELHGADEGGECTVIGHDRCSTQLNAALLNGAAGHALDFDDVITVMGHPTAPVAPVVMAVAERLGSSGADAIAALVVGIEAECRVARLLGRSHYAGGWHGTATFGTFGATAAAGHLMRLDQRQMCQAFGIAGTQAAGLKSVFGTMTKPLQVGKAAQNGLLAARLAAKGYTSDPDMLASTQGFAGTQSTTINAEALLERRSALWVNEVLFKYHAACYLTHATIEAAAALRSQDAVAAADIEAVTVDVNAVCLGVCNIPAPRTGLECKFSLRMACALALIGEDTFDNELFSDATARRGDLQSLCRRIEVVAREPGNGATVSATLADGRTVSRSADVTRPERNLGVQQGKLEHKFLQITKTNLGTESAREIIQVCRGLESEPTLARLLRLCAPHP